MLPRARIAVNTRAFFFEVRACSGARIHLMENPDSLSSSVVVVIGDDFNTRTTISIPDGLSVGANTPNILSCEVFRKFWISWENRQIRVGRGVPYEEIIVYHDFTHVVTLVGLSTGLLASGTWQFLHEEGRE